jgi:hypothetical protein
MRKTGFGEEGTVTITDGFVEYDVDYADYGKQVELVRTEDGEELTDEEGTAIADAFATDIVEAVQAHITDMAEYCREEYYGI